MSVGYSLDNADQRDCGSLPTQGLLHPADSIPVTLGNIVGGSGFVYWVIYRKGHGALDK
jgi:hypothetical protein